jgi:hypothetical protein
LAAPPAINSLGFVPIKCAAGTAVRTGHGESQVI